MPDFQGQVVIITGAGSGIGRATALKLAKNGAILALSDVNEDAVSITRQMCRDVGGQQEHMAKYLNVRSTSEINGYVDAVVAKYGSIHHVFNCAGVNPTKYNVEHVTDEYWQKLIDTNLKGTFAMTRACIPHMKEGSSFVNVSSCAGLHPTAQFAVYCATKYGIIGFSKCVALEVGPRGIRVNVIAPGVIQTPTNASVRAGPEELQEVAKSIGLRRVGSADEVADVVAFLFSQESKYMNGSVLEIDGGFGLTM